MEKEQKDVTVIPKKQKVVVVNNPEILEQDWDSIYESEILRKEGELFGNE